MRKQVSLIAKFLTASVCFLGVILSLTFARQDGYSSWSKRLLYFTTQSNILIGAVMLIMAICALLKVEGVWKERLYLIRYVSTVAITITGLIFCALLAPFAGDEYNSWTFWSILSHALSPALAIADFFIDDYKIFLTKRHALYCIIPLIIYFIMATILGSLNVDFGRGDPYPYYFLNFNTKAGLFGFVNEEPYPMVGSFYWIVLMAVLVFGLGVLYAKINNVQRAIYKISSDGRES